MTRAFLIGAVFLLTLTSGANAQRITDLSGNQLLRDCTDTNNTILAHCLGYIAGVSDGVTMTLLANHIERPIFLIPDNVTSEQLKDVVVKYLKDHHETRQLSAGVLVLSALREAFPAKS